VPDVSVSLVNTNSRELLLACLESLQGAEVEIVVLDNASEDGSVAAVRERFPGRRVRVLFQPHLDSRTRHRGGEWAAALALADDVTVTDV
jgi:glycosyltransferase involved in cell wall biosynthesis